MSRSQGSSELTTIRFFLILFSVSICLVLMAIGAGAQFASHGVLSGEPVATPTPGKTPPPESEEEEEDGDEREELFNPGRRSTEEVARVASILVLMGEVSGNWTNTGARSIAAPQPADRSGQGTGIRVTLPSVVASAGKDVSIPVEVRGVANKDVISYEFELRYDPAVIQPHANAIDVAGTVSRGLMYAVNAGETGVLRVAVYGPMPINQNGILLNLRFVAVGNSGSDSPLTFKRFMFNEGLEMTSGDGEIEISDAK